MECEVCLWETHTNSGWVLRTYGIDPRDIERRLEGLSFRAEHRPWGSDLFFHKREDWESAKEKLGRFVYSDTASPLEEVVGNLLKDKGLTLSVAESCTGGLLCARIVNVPGSSAYFVGGLVVYSNALKEKLLGVRRDTISRFGAVSAETCGEMLAGLKDRFGSACGVAITGIAGPGGTEEKREGLTYVGIYVGDKEVIKKIVWGYKRNINRYMSTQLALNTLRELLLSLYGDFQKT
ncbi:MAG TPA: nicotinamide-nucleotide amidohydrolase family protein [Aquifex aeolicus]|nr:nicotinamide-nucleotide amidohydrolase family protein [Aquifex aeolicus]